MKKTLLWVTIAAGASALAAIGIYVQRGASSQDAEKAELAEPGARASRSSEHASAGERDQRSPEAIAADLVEQKTPQARLRMLQAYVEWAGKPELVNARRALITGIINNSPPLEAAELIATAVSKDPTPLAQDEMLDTAAKDLAPVWQDPNVFAQGRDMLRLTPDAKGQAVLIRSMTRQIESPTTDTPINDQERHRFTSDLIQVYQGTENQTLRGDVLKGVNVASGSELAEVIENPDNLANSRMAMKIKEREKNAAEFVRKNMPEKANQ